MKAYRRISIALLLNLALFVMVDVLCFLYGSYSWNAYHILPFDAYPSWVRGTKKISYDMWNIFSKEEYSESCASIDFSVQSSPDVEALCIYTLSQYAWKKDSLLMEVILQDESKQWLIASPSASECYECQLNLIPKPTEKELSTYHRIHLQFDKRDFITKHNLNITVILCLIWVIVISYGLLVLSIPTLWIISIVLAIIHSKDIAKESTFKKIVYIIIPLIPIVVFALLRISTYTMIYA